MQSAVTVRMSAALMEQCRIAANAEGRPVAAWLRKLAASEVDLNDPEPQPTLPRRAAAPKPHPDIGGLVRIADHLANLCQRLAAHESRDDGRIPPILDPRKLEDLRLDLEVALDRVIDRIERLRHR